MTKDSDLTFLVGEEKKELTRNQIIEASLSGEENIGDFISGHNSARSAIKKKIQECTVGVEEIKKYAESYINEYLITLNTSYELAQALLQKYLILRKGE